MHHSASTPAGVDGGARTPPATPKKGGKMLAVRVQMLDDSISMFQIQVSWLLCYNTGNIYIYSLNVTAKKNVF